jgi:hypothetical protein
LTGQELFFCESHTENGEPVNAALHWKIKPWGSTIFILFNNGSKITDDLLYIFIDKLTEDSFQPFDSKAVTIRGEMTWFAESYKFVDPGEYDISIVSSTNKRLVKQKLKIEVSETYSAETLTSTNYYSGSTMLFCERVFSNKPYGIRKDYAVSKNDGIIFVMLDNKKPLNTEIIYVDIWKKGIRTFEYDQFVETKKFKVDPEWQDTYFRYKFIEPGDYKISISADGEVPMNSKTIKVYR